MEHLAASAGLAGSPSKQCMDQDLLLARALQEQERAFLMLSAAGGSAGSSLQGASSYFGAASEGDEGEEEGLEDLEDLDDEELARRLQSQEDEALYRQHLHATMGGFGLEGEEEEEEELDYDELGYEALNLLGDAAGKVSRGLHPDAVARLPTVPAGVLLGGQQQQQQLPQEVLELARRAYASSQMCAICQCGYEEGEALKLLPCAHGYHDGCVDRWLADAKTCPICSREVAAAGGGGEGGCGAAAEGGAGPDEAGGAGELTGGGLQAQ